MRQRIGHLPPQNSPPALGPKFSGQIHEDPLCHLARQGLVISTTPGRRGIHEVEMSGHQFGKSILGSVASVPMKQ